MLPTSQTDPLRRQLEIYEESWKTDHEEVKRILWYFEDQLAVGLALFKAIHDRYWTWQVRVSNGVQEYDPQEEQELKDRFVWWLRPCKQVMTRLDQLEERYGVVEGGHDFRRRYRETRQILKTWTAPTAPTAPMAPIHGSKDIDAHTDRVLTLDEMADELNTVSQPAKQASVPLKHEIDPNRVF